MSVNESVINSKNSEELGIINGLEGQKNSLLVMVVPIILFILVFSVHSFLETPNASQIALEVLLLTSFPIFVIYAYLKHGWWILLLFCLEFLAISFAEYRSVYEIQTYFYKGWIVTIFDYPIAIALGWMILLYSTYCCVNIIFDREGWNVFGVAKRDSFWKVVIYIFMDGSLFLMFGLLNEALGIDLGWWGYVSRIQPKFFGAPTETLYAYLSACLVFNGLLRIAEYFSSYNYHPTKLYGIFDFLSVYLLLIYALFLILSALIRFDADHWAVLLGGGFYTFLGLCVILKFFRS